MNHRRGAASLGALLAIVGAMELSLQTAQAREKTREEILEGLKLPEAPAAKATTPAQSNENGIDFCPFLQKTVDAGAAGNFDALINRARPVKSESPVTGKTFSSLIRFGDGACAINNAPPGPSHICFASASRDDPKIENLYQALVESAVRCLEKSITTKIIDQPRKIKIKGVEFDNYDDKVKRRSTFSFAPQFSMTMSLEKKLECKDMLDCRWVYGLSVSSSVLGTGDK